ncbi:NUDIX domain-containing protein [Enterococcus rivorum]|uniref:NUDIX domain-containing protein n=1 Tax=Enterococcus rivorum TaxID=762845 RepID=UPI0024812A84|nr:NUDIX domain-containing protein [Enterococcus rivorum]
MRAFENIFETLKREVKEECGLPITKINTGKIETVSAPYYEVQSYTPYYSVQNIAGRYPIMMDVFLCEAEGNLLKETDESKNIAWRSVEDISKLLNQPNKFYAMHFGAIKKIITELL